MNINELPTPEQQEESGTRRTAPAVLIAARNDAFRRRAQHFAHGNVQAADACDRQIDWYDARLREMGEKPDVFYMATDCCVDSIDEASTWMAPEHLHEVECTCGRVWEYDRPSRSWGQT